VDGEGVPPGSRASRQTAPPCPAQPSLCTAEDAGNAEISPWDRGRPARHAPLRCAAVSRRILRRGDPPGRPRWVRPHPNPPRTRGGRQKTPSPAVRERGCLPASGTSGLCVPKFFGFASLHHCICSPAPFVFQTFYRLLTCATRFEIAGRLHRRYSEIRRIGAQIIYFQGVNSCHLSLYSICEDQSHTKMVRQVLTGMGLGKHRCLNMRLK
jgi:hypothetical protein